jgi:rhamnulokinase
MNTYGFLAIDIGATSGRAVAGIMDGVDFRMQEVHRFPNHYIEVHGRYHWDVFALYEEIKKGITACRQQGLSLHSIGIDTWGVDFGYIGGDGAILGLPRAYRDPCTDGAPEETFDFIPREELYRTTGIQIMSFNSIFQLFKAQQKGYSPYIAAERILFMPDLLAYMLTGREICEYTIASTSQMLNPYTKKFDRDLLEALNIYPELAINPVMPGTVVGNLSESIARELNMDRIPVIAVAGHDTASAVAAVPAEKPGFAYLSSGTWSLMGIETEQPIINDASMKNNFTNEGGIEGTIRFLKNITGLWILEECRREWTKSGKDYSYPQIVEMAQSAAAFPSRINPDDPAFVHPESMQQAIVGECKRTMQKLPQTDSEFAGLIFHSLANRYGEVLKLLQEMSPVAIEKLHVIGGGSQNKLLNQLTANATGIPVIAGPVEATAIGNIMIQAKAAGLVKDRWEMRKIISSAFPVETFLPQ